MNEDFDYAKYEDALKNWKEWYRLLSETVQGSSRENQAGYIQAMIMACNEWGCK